jgi:glutamine synthetase
MIGLMRQQSERPQQPEVSMQVRCRNARDAAEQQAQALVGELAERGIRTVAVTFVNHAGSVLVKGIPLERLPRMARDGVGFSPVADAFGATGLIDPAQSLARPDGDLRLVPDPESLAVLDAGGGWAWAAGDRYSLEGLPYAADQRGFCRRQLQALTTLDLTLQAGFEIEWMVGMADEGGPWRPAMSGGPYGAARLIEGLDYLSAVAEALDAAGLEWLQLHPEYGSGQFELSLAPGAALQAADALVRARLVIQRVTGRFGWRCSFSPVVSPDLVGNGGHLHLSLERAGVPLFSGGNGPAGLRDAGEQVLAGLLHELPALMPLACALAVSYRRLQPGRWAAPFQVWGVENREAALRLILAGADGEPAHLELKVADLSANPYLLLGGVMAVIRHALHYPVTLPPPVVGDPGRVAPPGHGRLPLSLSEAIVPLSASSLLREAMGDQLHHTLVEAREAEVRRSERLSEAELILSTRAWPLTSDGPPAAG